MVAERVGDRDGQRWARGNLIGMHLIQGEWVLAAGLADEFIAECEAIASLSRKECPGDSRVDPRRNGR